MDAITLTGLILYSTGAFLFAASLFIWAEQRLGARRADAAGLLTVAGPGSASDVVNVVLSIASVVWFATNALLLAAPAGATWAWWLGLGYVGLAFAYPPLIMHAVACDPPGGPAGGPRASAPWRWVPWLTWLASLACTGAYVGGSLGWVPRWPRLFNSPGTVLGLLFLAASAYAVASMRRVEAGPAPVTHDRAQRSQLVAFGFMAVVFLVIVFGGFDAAAPQRVLVIVAHSLPLLFFAVGTYHDSRSAFVDLLFKRGSAFVVSLGALLLFFAAVEPWLDGQDLGAARPWFYALALLPLVILMPWLQLRLERYIDQVWLGREHTPLSASRLFLAAIQRAPDEAALRETAEATLSTLFDTEVRLCEADGPAADVQPAAPGGLCEPREGRRGAVVDIPLRGAASHLVLRTRQRESGVPILSEDITLLSLLGELFAVMLAQTRLQSQRRAHDRQARELALQASRSELKALRAQINPHFLFNALNTIGGLIGRDPEEADRVVERLAEVFRYTLTRSDAEWVRIEEELDFVRAYLDVERARFGDRLTVGVEMDRPAAACLVPTMAVQTLVENAIKHGVAQVRGSASVSVEARAADGRLDVLVTNNGPLARGSGGGTATARSGHGLANVRARLAGYFGDEASLTLDDHAEAGRTRAHLRLPAVNLPPVAASAPLEHVP